MKEQLWLLTHASGPPVGRRPPVPKDRRRNNCRLPDVEHVFNVLGTMESCPTYFCLSSKPNNAARPDVRA